ncbi:dol-P-Man:Man(7)GlcNAc(2)-PP-Dol alpha-1,6-mannosyltransferase isoform X2 [Onthophagus taurus]|nr:probable Dol-P-Man:Man(7)GlcNAc(2)-PP-Dol alpha-1,6-mannosyltransferase isoform X2 [Onthophagus taurus]
MKFLLCSGAAIIIFRFDVALFLGLLLIYDVYLQRLSLRRFIQICVPAGIGFLLLSVVVDSIFWQRPIWPEGEVIWFNVILNKSSNYGTSPFLWYFYSAIPRGMAASVFLIPLGIFLDQRAAKICLPALLFVLLYSFLPHKELRFIIYVFPLLNVPVATACHRIWENRHKNLLFYLSSLGVSGHLYLNVLFTIFLLNISSTNYPGGVAMSKFHRLYENETNVNVHICNLAAQTGVTRFTEINSGWIYNKTEHLNHGDPDMFEFTHLIVEAKSKYSTNLKPYTLTHDIVDSVEAFHKIVFNYYSFPPIQIKMKPVLFILKRKDNYKDLLPIIPQINITEMGSGEESEEVSNLKVIEESKEEDVTYEEKVATLQKELMDSEDVTRSRDFEDSYIDFEERLKIELMEMKLREERESEKNKEDVERIKEVDEIINESKEIKSPEKKKEKSNEKIKSKKIEKSSKLINQKEKPDLTLKSIEKSEPTEKKNVKKLIKRIVKDDMKQEKMQQIKIEEKPTVIQEKSVEEKIKSQEKVKSQEQLKPAYKDIPKLKEKGKVKESIKNIIRDFKKNQILSKIKPKTEGAKQTIKKIIEEDKTLVEMEELRKLQHQILGIIEENPNILNKEAIKTKINEAVFKDIIDESKLEMEIVKPKVVPPVKLETEETTKEESEEITIEESTEEFEISDIEKSVIPKTAIYDEFMPFNTEFEAANEHIENLMIMLEEIVSNMEVNEDLYVSEE